MPTLKCPWCGEEVDQSLTTCPYCGMILQQQTSQASEESPSIILSPWKDTNSADQLFAQMLVSGDPSSLSSLLKERAGFSLLSRREWIEGTIVKIRTQEETLHETFLSSLLSFIKDLIWPSSVSENASVQKKRVTTIRLRTPAGTYHDACLEGIPGGALLEEGDKLSLTGRYHRGLFIVSSGHNHTSKADIYSRSQTATRLMALVMLIIALVVVSLAFFWLHLFKL